jgi:hypothetical protein
MVRSRALPLVAVVLLATSCTGTHATDERSNPGARYLAIATAGNRGLETALDRLDGPDREDLAAARADLRAAAAVERRFDRSLLAIVFPPAIEATAHDLVLVNQARARISSAAATSASLRELRRYERRLARANAAVEHQVRILRSQLGLPPPDSS